MKFLFALLSFFSYFQLFAQTSTTAPCLGFQESFNWARSTDTRSEAMGLTASTTTNNVNTSHYNPAAIGSLKGIQASVTYANQPNLISTPSFFNTAIGVEFKDYLKIQFSRFSYHGNFDDAPTISSSSDAIVNSYTLGVGAEPLKGFYVGGNLKLIESSFIDPQRSYTLTGDLGLLKKFELSGTEGQHTVKIGASVTNVTAQKLNHIYLESKTKLDYPVIGLAGFSYSFGSVNKKVFESKNLLGATLQADYINQLNLDLRDGLRFGIELAVAEMIYLRGGYYQLSTCDHGFPDYNRDQIQSITYGIGAALPLKKWTNLPLSMNIDFASISQPSYIYSKEYDDRFISINTRLAWSFE